MAGARPRAWRAGSRSWWGLAGALVLSLAALALLLGSGPVTRLLPPITPIPGCVPGSDGGCAAPP